MPVPALVVLQPRLPTSLKSEDDEANDLRSKRQEGVLHEIMA